MGLYADYLTDIENRKTEGLGPKPIDDGALLSEVIENVKDVESELRQKLMQTDDFELIMPLIYMQDQIKSVFSHFLMVFSAEVFELQVAAVE